MSVIAVNGNHAQGETHRGNARERVLLTLVLCTLVRSGAALAGDPLSIAEAAKSEAGKSGRSSPGPASLPAGSSFSLDRSFAEVPAVTPGSRQRPHSIFNEDLGASASPSLDSNSQSVSIWQQLSQYKSQDRIRLLTLWHARSSTLSLQAGNHGGPSLQWSSPWMARDTGAGGLLDRLFLPSLRGSPNTLRSGPLRPAAAVAIAKPAEAAPLLGAK